MKYLITIVAEIDEEHWCLANRNEAERVAEVLDNLDAALVLADVSVEPIQETTT